MIYFLICVVLVCQGQLASSRRSTEDYDKALGTGFDISKVMIGKSILTKGLTIFKSIPRSCLLSQRDLGRSEESWNYYSNIEELVKSFEVTAGLSSSFLSLISLGASLSGTYGKVVTTKKNVNGATHAYFMHTHKNYLDKDCVREFELDNKFKKDFMALKRNIRDPHLAHSWSNYKYFVKKYGTHYVTEITYGASATQYLSAESLHHFTKRDFKAKACLDLAVPAHVGLVKVKPCVGFSRGKQQNNYYSNMSDNFVVLGGRSSTRNKIIGTRSIHYIEKLLNEGRKYKSPVSYKFESIADLLMIEYSNTRFVNQAVNFKSYVEGFVNFGCAYKTNRQIELQKFELRSTRSTYPLYVCTLAPEGCNKNSDCKFRGKCKCRGDTCVRHEQSSALNGNMKISARINTKPGMIDQYCSLSFLGCKCKRPFYARERKEVWKFDRKKKIAKKNARAKMMTDLALLNEYS